MQSDNNNFNYQGVGKRNTQNNYKNGDAYSYETLDYQLSYSEDENDYDDEFSQDSEIFQDGGRLKYSDKLHKNDFKTADQLKLESKDFDKMDIIKKNQVLYDQYQGLIKIFDINRAKGQIWMMISALMTTIMNLIIKEQSKSSNVNVLQAVVIRSLFLAAGCYAHIKKDQKNVIDIPNGTWKFVLLRGIFGFCSATSFFLAIDYLNLSMAVSLYFTSPILTALICYMVLGEKLGKLEIIGIFSAMFGVILLTQPEAIFPTNGFKSKMVHQPIDHKFYLGVFFAIFGSLNNAFVFLVCRKIGKDLHQSIHPFYFALMTSIGATLALSFSNLQSYPLTKSDFILLSLCGICSWIQQEGQSISLQHEKAGRSASINYLVVFLSFIFDVLIFGETVKGTDIAGAIFIIFFTLLNAVLKCYGKSD
eukprot:403373411